MNFGKTNLMLALAGTLAVSQVYADSTPKASLEISDTEKKEYVVSEGSLSQRALGLEQIMGNISDEKLVELETEYESGTKSADEYFVAHKRHDTDLRTLSFAVERAYSLSLFNPQEHPGGIGDLSEALETNVVDCNTLGMMVYDAAKRNGVEVTPVMLTEMAYQPSGTHHIYLKYEKDGEVFYHDTMSRVSITRDQIDRFMIKGLSKFVELTPEEFLGIAYVESARGDMTKEAPKEIKDAVKSMLAKGAIDIAPQEVESPWDKLARKKAQSLVSLCAEYLPAVTLSDELQIYEAQIGDVSIKVIDYEGTDKDKITLAGPGLLASYTGGELRSLHQKKATVWARADLDSTNPIYSTEIHAKATGLLQQALSGVSQLGEK